MSATPASMLQVVASGLQDRERLNTPAGKPSIQFYKSVMRKRTRWASQWRRVEFDNLADFGRTAVCTLPINGELITRATLVIDLPDIYTPQIAPIQNGAIAPSWAWTNGVGHAICSDVQMLINDTIIDQFDSRSLEVLDEQTRPVEHFDSTDLLIARNPSNFSDQETLKIGNNVPSTQTNPQTLEIVFPFWWNRGPGPQALPIQALWKDKVQLKCTFRTMQDCVYTSTRVDPRNPPLSANQGTGPLPNIAGCGFYTVDPAGPEIYSAASTDQLAESGLSDPFNGSVMPGYTMPASFHFVDAYWIVEYVSLEDREASAYRMADLEIPIEQHIAMPVVTTGGAQDIRIRMDQAGLVRDLTWVAQRVEAPSYNAYFLFSRDLGPPATPATLVGPTPLVPVQSPCDIPWWPNAQIPNWDYGDGYIRPAFTDQRSDPISAAKMQIRGLPRFEHEGPTIFRSLIPVLNCKRAPIIDRYIYRYDFGFWPTGGLAEAYDLPVDEIRGYSNWDKLPKRELSLTMNQDTCTANQWVIDSTQQVLDLVGQTYVNVDSFFKYQTDGFLVRLQGAHPGGVTDVSRNNGYGAAVYGIVDFNQIRQQKGYIGLFLRLNDNGAAALVMQTTSGYTWIAVAGAGGYGQFKYGAGGYAGSAAQIGWQGGNYLKTHDAVGSSGGNIVYNNSGPNNVVATEDFFEMFFTTIYAGAITEVQITVALTANRPVGVYVNSALVETLSSSVDVPLQQYTISVTDTTILPAGSMIDIYVGTAPPLTPIYVTQTTAMTNDGSLACTVVVKSPNTLFLPGSNIYGGGGGGADVDAGIGQADGIQMPTDTAFVVSHKQTGGVSLYAGGDGYYGGGSGSLCGGGGGSYVSDFITQVNSPPTRSLDFTIGSDIVGATLTPLLLRPLAQPSFNIYSWVTRYNRLRINSGRGALMFNEAT